MVYQRKLIQTRDIELCCDLGSVFIDKDEYGVHLGNGHYDIGLGMVCYYSVWS